MGVAYKFARDLSNPSFNYGNLEETLGFVLDNYNLAMRMYLVVVKSQAEIEFKREEAHKALQKLRNDEERWRKRNRLPKGFDETEHQKRKDFLAEAREAEYIILFEGIPIEQDKLGRLVINNLSLFRIMHKIDKGTKSKLSPIIRKVISIAIWPTLKLIEINERETKNQKVSDYLQKTHDMLSEIPKRVEKKIVNS